MKKIPFDLQYAVSTPLRPCRHDGETPFTARYKLNGILFMCSILKKHY